MLQTKMLGKYKDFNGAVVVRIVVMVVACRNSMYSIANKYAAAEVIETITNTAKDLLNNEGSVNTYRHP